MTEVMEPGRYALAMAWLAHHPGATISEVAVAINANRYRAQLVLRYGLGTGAVRRERSGQRDAWHWHVTGEPVRP